MNRALALGLLLVVPACGGGDGGNTPPTTVEVNATDALRFDPATVRAKAGEKVAFRITNTGKLAHEFAIGDAAFREAHRAAMTSGGSHDPHAGHGAEGEAVDVPAGQTVTLEFTMPKTAPAFACYVDNHAAAGMTGVVVYD